MTTLATDIASSHLRANLEALEARSPRVAAQVREAQPRADVEWIETDDPGAPSAKIDGRWLASRRRPRDEGDAFASGVDLTKSGAVVVMGFGLGYHVGALAKRAGRHSAVIVFEPDVGLLRSALERVDCSQWIRETNLVVLTDASDGAALARGTQGLEPLLSLGVTFVEHAPSRSRLDTSAQTFAETVTRLVGSVRTQVITTMMQMGVTVRNLLMNCDAYALGAGVGELANIAAGAPAIVVSAGPSLRRNIDLLKTTGLRDRCVIIAVQTVLKQMLKLGVRPHFVTALDYHEISARFYEGLTADDVEGVTLIAEAKANPAILQSFPGAIRLVESEYLDKALGRDLAGSHGAIRPGATVAHLAYYLARHLGCDPVMLIGQDLAFTDGQYYGAGAAIHDIWASELNDFNTLEMMEWQRIVRWRGHLHSLKDHLGRPVYTDDQMSAYIAQFERDFLSDSERGLTVIDASEGGVMKAHSQSLPLREALSRWAGPAAPKLPAFPQVQSRPSPSRRRQLVARIDRVRRDVRSVASLSREAAGLLARMAACQRDQLATNRLIENVQALRERVEKLDPAYGLVHKLNQAGSFKRFRADRLLKLAGELEPMEKQRRQIERDQMNVAWLAEAAESLEGTLSATLEMLGGGERLTRDPAPPSEEELTGEAAAGSGAEIAIREKAGTIAAVLQVDPDFSGLGTARDLGAMFLGRPLLRATLERLARCDRIHRAILLTHEPERVRGIIGGDVHGLDVQIERVDADLLRATRRTIGPARLWARACWRGGLGYATAWDEAMDPRLLAGVMAANDLQGALVVGADWALVDPALCDRLVERFAEHRGSLPLVFAQGAPGLCGVVIGAGLARDLASGKSAGDHFASIGGVLGYVPTRPRTDPIAGSACVLTTPRVRDSAFRAIPDDAGSRARLEAIAAAAGGILADGESLVRAADLYFDQTPPPAPQRITLELCVDRALPARRSEALRHAATAEQIAAIAQEISACAPSAAITLAGAGDPALHPEFAAIVRSIRAAGAAGLHVRTDLLADSSALDALAGGDVDVVSVELHAGSAEVYAQLTGVDGFGRAMDGLDQLLHRRRQMGGGMIPWVVPRMERRDAVYGQIEEHFDKSLYFTGACVLDALAHPRVGERIEPFAKPVATAKRDWRERMLILCDGNVVADERDVMGAQPVANVHEVGVEAAWGRLMERRYDAWRRHGDGHPDLWTGW